MLIFDDIPRTDLAVPDQHEADFAYLNRSGRTEAARVRQVVEDWFSHYPAKYRAGLIARFRSPIDDQHQSAFFELFIHELLLRRGLQILEIEPKLVHTTKSPDFFVQTKDGGKLYVECVLATGRSQQAVAAEARLNLALTVIDRTPSPRHFLDLSVHGRPAQTISTKRMKSALVAWIAGLPNDDSAMDATPFRYREHGVTITLRAFPRRHPERADRAIGVRFFPVGRVTVHDDLRGALEKKSNRYGALNQPYIVAVNALAMFARDDAAVDALVGSPCTTVVQTETGFTHREGRQPDGVWWGPNGARRQGLSAVFSTEGIDPWHFATRSGRLIRNPWATAPIHALDLGVDDLIPKDGSFHRIPGLPLGEVFGLPDRWPEA